MADKTITFSKSIVAKKQLGAPGIESYITQLSKPIILKGVSTKTCQNVLYSIDGINFTKEKTIGDDHVLSMAIVPFQLGGPTIDSSAVDISHSIFLKACSYILGGRDVNEDIKIEDSISQSQAYTVGNGAYRYLLQYLAKNKDKIEWDTGDLFTSLDADMQDSFGGSDVITDSISVTTKGDKHVLSIDTQDAILKPAIIMPSYSNISNNVITIEQSAYFFLFPDSCPTVPQRIIIDNFWRGGGLLVSCSNSTSDQEVLILYIFAVT